MGNRGVVKKKEKNQLHKKIASRIQYPDCKIFKSLECGGTHNIPLFRSKEKGNDTEYCNLDLLILKNNKIKVIIEIEESNIKPTQICGKYLTSALSSYYIHGFENNEVIGMDDSVTFIQILDTSKLDKNTSKTKQFEYIEKSIQNIIPIKDSKIDNYRLFFGNKSDFNNGILKEIFSFVQGVLN